MAVYLNNNATTHMPDIVKREIIKWLNAGNASVDKKSGEVIEHTKNYIYKLCHISPNDYEVIFTSCASESNSTIINSVKHKKGKNIIISGIEHNSIMKSCLSLDIKVKVAKPNKYGIIEVEEVESLIDKNTVLISIMFVNNEIGSINPIKEIGAIAQKKGILFHTDAVQMFGKCRLNLNSLNIDALSMSFHKLYGPPGIGLLIIRRKYYHTRNFKIEPLIYGSQNNNLRGGTENVPYIAASLMAMKWNFKDRKQKNAKICKLTSLILTKFANKYMFVNYYNYNSKLLNQHDFIIVYYGYKNDRSQVCNTLLISLCTNKTKLCNAKMKQYLEDNGVIVGIGSACNAKNKKASHVLFSMNVPSVMRRGTLRISLGDYNTAADIIKFCQVYNNMIKEFIKI